MKTVFIVLFSAVLALSGCISDQARQVTSIAQQESALLAQAYPNNEHAKNVLDASTGLTRYMGPPKELANARDLPALLTVLGQQSASPLASGWWHRAAAWFENATGSPWWVILLSIPLTVLGYGTWTGAASRGISGLIISTLAQAIESHGGDQAKLMVAATLSENPRAKMTLDAVLAGKGLLAASNQPAPPAVPPVDPPAPATPEA